MIDPRNIDYHEIARRGDTEVMEVFLDAGLSPELTDRQGHGLLMIAAYNGQPEMTTLLLEHGADPNRPGPNGTPLMGVCFKGHAEVAHHLLAAGADPDQQNEGGATALHFAALFKQEEIASLLLERGADPALADAQGRTAVDLARANGHTELAARLEKAEDQSASL